MGQDILFTFSSYIFLQKQLPRSWLRHDLIHSVEMVVRYCIVFSISCHVDDLDLGVEVKRIPNLFITHEH